MATKSETKQPEILVCLVSALLVAGACSKIPNGPGGNGGQSGDASVGGAGGIVGGAGGSPGGAGGARTGGASGTPPFGIPPDAGLPSLDAGLPGLVDAGLVATCPAAPMGKMCGGQGGTFACVLEGTQPPEFCLCLLGRWACPGDNPPPGVPDAGIGPPAGMTCPAGATTGAACTQVAAICTAGMGGCVCLPGAGGMPAWLCSQ